MNKTPNLILIIECSIRKGILRTQGKVRIRVGVNGHAVFL